jgi:hypothetical protein
MDKLCERIAEADKDGTGVERLLKILGNIQAAPTEEKFRKILTTNAKIAELLTLDGAMDLLTGAGFTFSSASSLVLAQSPDDASRLAEISRLLTEIKTQNPNTTASPPVAPPAAKADGNMNLDLTEETSDMAPDALARKLASLSTEWLERKSISDEERLFLLLVAETLDGVTRQCINTNTTLAMIRSLAGEGRSIDPMARGVAAEESAAAAAEEGASDSNEWIKRATIKRGDHDERAARDEGSSAAGEEGREAGKEGAEKKKKEPRVISSGGVLGSSSGAKGGVGAGGAAMSPTSKAEMDRAKRER